MGMRAVVEFENDNGSRKYCIARWTGRSGLSAKVKTYCGNEVSIGTDGVLQLPDEIECCGGCEAAVKITIERNKRSMPP